MLAGGFNFLLSRASWLLEGRYTFRASVLNILVLVLVFISVPIGIAALRGGQVIGCGAALEPSHCAEPQAQQVYQAFLHHRQGWKVLSHADNCLRRWASRSASSSTCWARILKRYMSKYSSAGADEEDEDAA